MSISHASNLRNFKSYMVLEVFSQFLQGEHPVEPFDRSGLLFVAAGEVVLEPPVTGRDELFGPDCAAIGDEPPSWGLTLRAACGCPIPLSCGIVK